MSESELEPAYGTAALDAPATRAELERAIRSLALSDLELRDTVLKLAARVVALTGSFAEAAPRKGPRPPG